MVPELNPAVAPVEESEKPCVVPPPADAEKDPPTEPVNAPPLAEVEANAGRPRREKPRTR
jgi:hypothetical protein